MDLIIALNKPKDYTSQEAVTKVKRILKVKKAGHTGTLDPIATGLLLVCVNRATRLASYFSSLDKEYIAVLKFGEITDTQDAYGKILSKTERFEIDSRILEDTIRSFRGDILQIPPMFSALKHEGKPLYKLARKGIEIERKPREVSIHDIELLNINHPFVTFRAVCSKGTYIRTLCDDIGKRMGIGAHLYELRRTAIGRLRIEDSLSFEDLKNIPSPETGIKGIYTMDGALSWMPEVRIAEEIAKTVAHGNPIKVNNTVGLPDGSWESDGIRIKSPSGDLLAIGRFSSEDNMIKMDVVFAL